MGCFAFECSACGSHDQSGIVRGCVVKVKGMWVRGEYSEYGWVDCAAEGHDDPVQVWLQQFQSDYFESWGVPADALLGISVYCDDPARSCIPRRLQVWHALPAVASVMASVWAQRNDFTDAQAAMIGEYVWNPDGVATVADLHEMDPDALTCMLQDMKLSDGEAARFRSLLAADAISIAEFNAAWDLKHRDEDEDEDEDGAAAEGRSGFGGGNVEGTAASECGGGSLGAQALSAAASEPTDGLGFGEEPFVEQVAGRSGLSIALKSATFATQTSGGHAGLASGGNSSHGLAAAKAGQTAPVRTLRVDGAGTEAVNGVYSEAGIVNGMPSFEQVPVDDAAAHPHTIWYGFTHMFGRCTGTWRITRSAHVGYNNSGYAYLAECADGENVREPPLTMRQGGQRGWECDVQGAAPPPVLVWQAIGE